MGWTEDAGHRCRNRPGILHVSLYRGFMDTGVSSGAFGMAPLTGRRLEFGREFFKRIGRSARHACVVRQAS
jgi:hypothetical protein